MRPLALTTHILNYIIIIIHIVAIDDTRSQTSRPLRWRLEAKSKSSTPVSLLFSVTFGHFARASNIGQYFHHPTEWQQLIYVTNARFAADPNIPNRSAGNFYSFFRLEALLAISDTLTFLR